MDTKELIKKVRQVEIKTKGVVNQIFSGEYHSSFKGKGIDFSEVREYQLGDDIRNIDWNVTARFGHPFIKVFEEERELLVTLIVDLSGSQYFGSKDITKKQLAVEICATIAFSALKNNDKVGMILFTDKIEKFLPPKKNRSHILRILRELINFEPQGKHTNIKSALDYFNKTIKKRSIVFLISDFIDDNYLDILSIVARKHDLVCIKIQDTREKNIPKLGLIRLRDNESGKYLILNTNNLSLRKRIEGDFKSKAEDLVKIFKKKNIDSVIINTDDNYIKSLVAFFKSRMKRR